MITTRAQAEEHQRKHKFMLPREVVAAAGAAEKPKQKRKMNKTEAEWEMILKAEHPECDVKYEAYTLKLAYDLRYTPDFALCKPISGSVDFYEVKGNFVFSRAMQKPTVAATLFPHHRFFLAQKLSGSWNVTEIPKQ